MANISRDSGMGKSASATYVDFVEASGSSDDDNSINGCIRVASDEVPKEQRDEQEMSEDEEDAWETQSFYEDTLDALGGETIFKPRDDAIAPEVAERYRKRLREIGGVQFLQETIRNGSITAKKLITAFGIRPPAFLDGAPDAAFIPLLQAAMVRELSRRRKLPHINTIGDVVRLLKESENILVLTGAGISTSLGIPDFRSKENGLYTRLAGLGLSDPQEVFDIDVFLDDPTIFYSIAKDILPESKKFSPTHAFIELLQRKNKLLTQYTQNIDNLEMLAGIKPDKLIQCHGSFATATCVRCKYKVSGEVIFPDLRAGKVAKCEMCLKRMEEELAASRAGKKRKRPSIKSAPSRKQKYSDDASADEEESFFQEVGIMKPDITFFGEQLPAKFHDRLVDHDREKCDLLICIGTSLKVAPVSEIIGFLPPDTPQVYISKTPVCHVDFDVELLGSCDDVVAELCRRCEWEFKHEMIPKDLELKVEQFPGREHRYIIERIAPVPPIISTANNEKWKGEGNVGNKEDDEEELGGVRNESEDEGEGEDEGDEEGEEGGEEEVEEEVGLDAENR